MRKCETSLLWIKENVNEEKFELSPQEILDWLPHYVPDYQNKETDEKGCYPCNNNIKGYQRLQTEQQIIDALGKQPLAGSVDATPELRSFFGKDIFDQDEATLEERKTNGDDRMHAIVVMGVDVKNDCYVIRNSWGKDWGVKGYAKIRRHLVKRISCPLLSSKLTEAPSLNLMN